MDGAIPRARRVWLHAGLTASAAAAEAVAPSAPARLALLYVRDISATANALGLRRTATGANVALASGDEDMTFERTRQADELRYVALSQAAVDLLSDLEPVPASDLLQQADQAVRIWCWHRLSSDALTMPPSPDPVTPLSRNSRKSQRI